MCVNLGNVTWSFLVNICVKTAACVKATYCYLITTLLAVLYYCRTLICIECECQRCSILPVKKLPVGVALVHIVGHYTVFVL